MDNNIKKRTITGVAIISGAILVSVGVAGTVKLINEANATESKYILSAQTTNLMATNTTITKSGITYSLDDSTKQATVISLDYDKNASTGIAGKFEDGAEGLYINIPHTVSDDNGNTYSVKIIGDGSKSIFSANLITYLSKKMDPSLKIILPKTITRVASNAITGYSSAKLFVLEILNLSNKTTYDNNSITFLPNLYVYGVPGNGLENLDDYIDIDDYSIYDYTVDNNSKTLCINKGFFEDFFDMIRTVPVEAKVNIKIPDYMTINGVEYRVTEISKNAFDNLRRIETVVIPNTIKKVGARAFGGCNVRWVKFLSSDITINDTAFQSRVTDLDSSVDGEFVSNLSTVYGISGNNSLVKSWFDHCHELDKDTGIENDTKWKEIMVKDLSIKSNPSKTEYKVGEELDISGLVLKGTFYDDATNTSAIMPELSWCSPTTFTTAGTQTVTVTYGEKTATFNVNVEENVITLDKQGGTGGTDVLYIRSGQGIFLDEAGTTKLDFATQDARNKISIPSYGTHIFKGYYNGDKQVINKEGFFAADISDANGQLGFFNQQIGDCKILTARWEEYETPPIQRIYKIEFNANGGTGGPTPQEIVYTPGTTYVLKSEVPSKTGYRFIGWALTSDPNVQWCSAGGNFKIENLPEEQQNNDTIKLIALYQENVSQEVHKIELDKQGGTGGIDTLYWNPIEAKVYTDEGCTQKVGYKYTEDGFLIENLTNQISRPTKEGYKFAGYFTSNNVCVIREDGVINGAENDGSSQAEINNALGNCEGKLIAQWSKLDEPIELIDVENVKLDKTQATIKEGGNIQLTATVTPNNATNKKVTWKSSNTAVATVDATGYVTAKSEGTATITVTTVDGNKTATATITVSKEITDKNNPKIESIKGEKDSEGNYKVIIKASDESGIEKVLVNGTKIETKDSNGNYYFVPTQNGTYKIEVYDKAGNKIEQEYTENKIIDKTKVTAEEDSKGSDIVYIEVIPNKKIEFVKVNETEIKDKDSAGRYYFKPTKNGEYKVIVQYEDGTTEDVTYKETRITDDGNVDNGNKENNVETITQSPNITETGSYGTSKSGNGTIKTSTALTTLPKTGTKMGALIATIASGITAIFAWFKQRKEK